MNEPVKIGVIGCGSYAFQLIKRVLSIPFNCTVTAVTSRDLDSAGVQYCRERGIHVFQTIDELLNYGRFDVVMNPTPIHLHASITKQCLAAGFPVWMEKPPVATVQELDELNQFATSVRLPVAVCFNALYAGLVQQLKKELLDGRFGKIRRVKSIGAWIRTDAYFNRNSWAGKIKQGGQWILDGDINNPFAHGLCNNLFFAGAQQNALAEPEIVEAELYRCNDIESEDTSCLRILTRNGIEAMNWFTLGSKTEIPLRTVIETEKALITFSDLKDLKIEFADGRIEMHEAYQENRIEMLQHLCRTVRGEEMLYCDLAMTRPFTVTVNSAFESAGTICTVPEQYLRRINVGDTIQTVIDGIAGIMEQAFEANALFSEINVSWAVQSKKFHTENYKQFPVRFCSALLKNSKSKVCVN
ncbi:MAG: Gfo/Idh/MocA family oxidoreductase [Kiritimatiellales bacterium]